ncbi:hypothetical protein jhhlp_007738 [Lomentospora prolificans]|uniref:Tetratricopeptide repeat protein 1 n=1 Tax=Lomentospora prolificans TaxID=41688 RepID=A0A2N3N0F2_9PEZI|nr:hypothetical protein jhhlp_007738 [Lomentospora prolificans]
MPRPQRAKPAGAPWPDTAAAVPEATTAEKAEDEQPAVTFTPEEEANLVKESNERKAEANNLFTSKRYNDALAKYEEAASTCPHYLDYELAVLKCNVSACHLKLEEWKEAIDSATASLDGLSRIEKKEAKQVEEKAGKDKEEEEGVEEEIISTGASNAAPAPETLDPEEEARKKREEDVKRIRAKALMRRARARSELGGWQNLAGAEEDYKMLSQMDNLGPGDRKIVMVQLKLLPPRTKAAQEAEMAEMWGKLKQLGNGILKPFGLSTENFQFTKDEKSGGYSMNFQPGGPSS